MLHIAIAISPLERSTTCLMLQAIALIRSHRARVGRHRVRFKLCPLPLPLAVDTEFLTFKYTEAGNERSNRGKQERQLRQPRSRQKQSINPHAQRRSSIHNLSPYRRRCRFSSTTSLEAFFIQIIRYTHATLHDAIPTEISASQKRLPLADWLVMTECCFQ